MLFRSLRSTSPFPVLQGAPLAVSQYFRALLKSRPHQEEAQLTPKFLILLSRSSENSSCSPRSAEVSSPHSSSSSSICGTCSALFAKRAERAHLSNLLPHKAPSRLSKSKRKVLRRHAPQRRKTRSTIDRGRSFVDQSSIDLLRGARILGSDVKNEERGGSQPR